jgi:hypothetical protein
MPLDHLFAYIFVPKFLCLLMALQSTVESLLRVNVLVMWLHRNCLTQIKPDCKVLFLCGELFYPKCQLHRNKSRTFENGHHGWHWAERFWKLEVFRLSEMTFLEFSLPFTSSKICRFCSICAENVRTGIQLKFLLWECIQSGNWVTNLWHLYKSCMT